MKRDLIGVGEAFSKKLMCKNQENVSVVFWKSNVLTDLLHLCQWGVLFLFFYFFGFGD